jgi:hypothetical protein
MGFEKTFLTLTLVSLYSVLCTGLGLALLSALRDSVQSHSRSFVFSIGFTLGQAVLLLVWLVLAVNGTHLRFPITLTLSLTVLASVWGYLNLWRTHLPRPPAPSKPTQILVAALLFLAGVYLIRSFGPFLQGDAVAYYLTVAREAAIQGRHGLSWLNYAPFVSFGMEGHFAVLFSLGGEPAVTLFDGVVALNCLLLVYTLAKSIDLSTKAALFAVLTVLSTGGFEDALGGGKVDIASAQFGLAAIVLCFTALSEERRRFLYVILAGLVAGVCIISKVSNALILVVITIAFFSFWRKQVALRMTTAALWVVFGVATVLTMIPHFYNMYVTLGEPLLPFITLFQHAAMPPWAANAPKIVSFIHEQRTLSNLDIALLPFTWTFVDRAWMSGNISPMYLAFLPFGFFVRWTDKVKLIGWMSLAAIAAWIIISPYTLQTRYHFVGLMLLAVVTGHVVDRLLANPSLKRPILISLIFVGALTLGGARKIRHAIPYITGHLSRDAYFEKHPWLNSSWALAHDLNQRRSGTERVYLTRSTWYYSYFMNDDTLRSSQRPQEALKTWQLQWNAEAWQYVYDQGFRFVMASKKEAQEGELMMAQVKNAPPSLALSPVYEDDATVVYRLSAQKPETAP